MKTADRINNVELNRKQYFWSQAEGRWIDRVHMFICYSYNAARILDVYSE